MAPMIDMVFLLLVFFMCVSSLSQAGHRVPLALPESTAGETPKDLSNRIILSIQKEGNFFLGGSKIEEGGIEKELRELRERFPEIKLRIRADQATEFMQVKKAMSAATKAGISDYIYGTIQGE